MFVSEIASVDFKALPKLPPLPRRRYLDERLYQAEIKHVWKKSWLGVGHASEFSAVGSYRLLALPFAPVVVVRGKDGVLRAFLNSCQHRGATVIKHDQKVGCLKVMSCQYHGWTYDLSGKLIGIPDQESFQDLKIDDHSLVSLRCEQWGGFVFINFDKDAAPLLDWLAPVVERYAEVFEAPLRVVSKHTWDVNCNWKVVLDAFRETYHVDIIHTQTAAQLVDGRNVQAEMYPNGHNSLLTAYRPAYLQAAWDGVMAKTTLPRLPGIERREYVENVVTACIFPNIMCTIQAPGFPLLQWWPISVNQSRVDFTWYGMDWGDSPQPEEWKAITAAFETVIAEDLGNLVSIQQSLEADPDKGVPLSTKEVLLYQMNAEIDRLIGKENVPEGLYVTDILGPHLVS